MSLGISGYLTSTSIRSPLTPLLLVVALALGLLALVTVPREEEPQLRVPMIDVVVSAAGLKGPDAVELVTKPLEAIVKGIDDVDHVYTRTQDDQVIVTVRFLVGTSEDTAILRVQAKIRANYDRIPIGIPEPLIIGRGINDVPVVTLTLSPKPWAASRWTGKDLDQLAEKLRTELVKVDGIGLSSVVGDAVPQIRVQPDPEKLALYGITLEGLAAKLRGANQAFPAGTLRDAGSARGVLVGQTLAGVPDIGLLLLTARDGRPVYVRDVADVVVAPAPTESRVWTFATDAGGHWQRVPAATVAVSKRAGMDAERVSAAVHARVRKLQGHLIPADIAVETTRDYGETANAKVNQLLLHLGLATLSIVVLVWVMIGRREAGVTFVIIPVTILLALLAAELMGYTMNRVSLFALILSIGILVDDTIVVIENIARHWRRRGATRRVEAAVAAVAEVGNPTVVATLAVILALVPMLFVSGLMGPYMAPIPVNAAAAMLFSFFVAVTIAPWLMLKLAGHDRTQARDGPGTADEDGRLARLYRRLAGRIIVSRRSARTFLAAVCLATVLAGSLVATKAVTVKLLPFDDKSELDVVLDMPEGSSLEDTERTLFDAAAIVQDTGEARSLQAYVGTAAPINFNGLIRQYYLRRSPELGELQVDLWNGAERRHSSHAIALGLRTRLHALHLPAGGVLKVVEVPAGPPVFATLLAEIYGPDLATRRKVAEQVKTIFASIPFITDVDDSYKQPRPRLRISIDQDRLEFFHVEQQDVYDTVQMLLQGVPIGYSHRGAERAPMDIVLALPKSDLAWTQRLAATPVPANAIPGSTRVVELGDVVSVTREAGTPTIFRRDGVPADMVMAEMAGAYEAPIYGMLAVDRAIDARRWETGTKPVIRLHGQPLDESRPTLLWDGEWEVTYVTFRDMGAAFAAALAAIYILVVAQSGSLVLPLVVLAPVPLSLIGIMLGHWMLGAPFTATSMIGFIALAGIVVRNSVLLVDFIQRGLARGASLGDALIEAGAIRMRPILMTALSGMIGAAAILSDPIFQGLAISVLFGLATSTLLTVLVIPALYVAFEKTHQTR